MIYRKVLPASVANIYIGRFPRERQMWPTHNDGIRLYAHFWRTRHGMEAIVKARAAAQAFARKADLDGEKAWNEVADEIEKLEKH